MTDKEITALDAVQNADLAILNAVAWVREDTAADVSVLEGYTQFLALRLAYWIKQFRASQARVTILEDHIKNDLAWERDPFGDAPDVPLTQEKYDTIKDEAKKRHKELSDAERRISQLEFEKRLLEERLNEVEAKRLRYQEATVVGIAATALKEKT